MEQDTLTRELRRAKAGDEQALAALITRQMPLIRAIAARSVGPGLEFEDAVQEGLIALFFAMESYEEGRGAAFSTYASVCIQNAVADAARKAGRRKHAPLNSSVPLDDADPCFWQGRRRSFPCRKARRITRPGARPQC